jgi:DNA polymerase-3 subunit alpha
MLPCDDWLPAERLTEEFKAVGFYLSGHPLDDYMGPLKRKGVLTLDEVTAKAQNGALVAKIAGVVAGKQERKSARGNRFAFAQLSDTTGGYEVTLFSDTLETAREHLEVGAKVVVTVEATMESDQLKLLGRSVTPIDSAVADAGSMGLLVFIDEASAVAAVAAVLDDARRGAKIAGRGGPVQLCLMDPELPGEVEVDLGREYPVTPQIKGAIRSLNGVMEVQEI